MARSAYLAISADRYEACVRTLRFVGWDLRDVPLRMQARLQPDTPGVPLFDLQSVTNGNAEGLRVVGFEEANGLATTIIEMVINETTMEALPAIGERGDVSQFAYDVQATIAGRKRKLVGGPFLVLPGVTGADNAKAPDGYGYANQQFAPATWSSATLTYAEETIVVSIDGIDQLQPLVETASAAAQAAQDAQDVALATGNFFPSLGAAQAAALEPGTLFSTTDGAGTIIYYRQGATSPVEIGRALTAAALASEIAKNRSALFTTNAQPTSASSQIGDNWLAPSGTIYTRTPANGITIAGKVLLLGGRVPALAWQRAASQPIEALNARITAIENGAA